MKCTLKTSSQRIIIYPVVVVVVIVALFANQLGFRDRERNDIELNWVRKFKTDTRIHESSVSVRVHLFVL